MSWIETQKEVELERQRSDERLQTLRILKGPPAGTDPRISFELLYTAPSQLPPSEGWKQSDINDFKIIRSILRSQGILGARASTMIENGLLSIARATEINGELVLNDVKIDQQLAAELRTPVSEVQNTQYIVN